MVITHNLKAMNSQRQLSIVSGTVSKKAEKLSSGYKINRAADDAAGLSISEKMRRQIRGLTKATVNAEDGISMVQIADGALSEVQEMLQRMNELCVQAANGSNAASDRQNIQDEISQLITEIDRVAETTKFNETNLLDGTLSKGGRSVYNMAINNRKLEAIQKKYEADKEKFQLQMINNSSKGKVVSLSELANTDGTKIVYFDGESINNQEIVSKVITTQSPVTDTTASQNPFTSNIQNTDTAYDDLRDVLKTEIVPNAVEAIINAYSPAFDFLQGSAIGMGLELADAPGSSTLAFVKSNGQSYKLSVNVSGILDASKNLTEAGRNALEVTIVHEMMHAFMFEATTMGMASGDKFPLWFTEGMAQTAAGGYYNGNDWVAGLGITENSSRADIQKALQDNKIGSDTNASNYGTGYLASMYLGYLAGGSNLNALSIKSGLGKILAAVRSGNSLENVVKALTGKKSITDFENSFANNSGAVNFVADLTKLVGQGTGGVVGNLIKSDDILSNDENPNVTLFQLDLTADMIQNTYPGGYGVTVGGSATNKGTAGSLYPTAGKVSWDKPLKFTENKHAAGLGTSVHAGTDADMNNKIHIYIDPMDSVSIGVDQVDVRTEDLATLSIERVALALAQVSAQRSELGACQNRLEHTVNNLDNVVENTTASESQIRDTDMAKEMVAYSNANILQQAGQAMLAQMNQSSQGVLSLIA